jgi:hypothetical protein
MAGGNRKALEERWLQLTRELLPALAPERGWPVRHDHCFQRILLDHACGTRWYDAISGRPAYRAADESILQRAVALGEQVAEGAADLHHLNRQSLAWRGRAQREMPGT